MAINKEKLHHQFFNQYENLNERQRQAVDTIEGPVMVIAGPGTGKTQILASRIGKILLETDALPENILCLTYTDAGVVAMRKRLLNFIGPDAYKVNICTFHAFCNEVIQDNLSLFEKTALDAISELEQIELFKELIDSFPKNHPLKRYRGDVYYEIKNLKDLFSTMKQEGWTPAYVLQKIDEYVKDLPSRDEFIYKVNKAGQWKKGDLKQARLDEEYDKMEKLKAAVIEFDRFQKMMHNRRRYDFDDMINWVIKAFEENKNLLARYQEQFLYILADEYQDTSGTQNRIIELLINYWDKPNVFVVGDDDQSIFRFQGANIENMMQFKRSYQSDLFTVVLTNNYRSTQPILDASKTLIERNEERLVKKFDGLSKELVSSKSPLNELTHKPVIKEYDTPRQEMIDISLQIQKLLAEGTLPGRIAVIYKENKYGEELAEYFRLRKVPYYTKRNINILELPLAQKIFLQLNYLAAELETPYSGDEMLFELLHAPWFHIPAIEIARLSVEAANTRYSDEEKSFRKLLSDKCAAPARDLFTPVIHERLKQAGLVMEALVHDASNLTLQQIFENCVRKTGVLTHIMQSPDKHFLLQVLSGLFDFIKDETRRKPTLSLKEFTAIIELMVTEDIKLPLLQVNGNEKGVNLLTIHGSKGLEFEHVFFAGCNAGTWEKKRKPGGGYSFPDTLFESSGIPGSGNRKTASAEELRRMFYVALTRAEKYLTVSYSRIKNDGKEMEPSMFVAEMMEAQQLEPVKIIISDEVLSEFTAIHFTDTAVPKIEKLEQEYAEKLLEKFSMNVTALNNYLKCPLNFYFNTLIRIPSGRSEAAEFGSSVHYALEQLFRKMQDSGNEQFPSKEIFLKDFDWYMHRNRECFTKEQFDRRSEYGHEILGRYYDEYVHKFNKIVAIERNIRNVVVHGIPLKGKLDKLEFDGKSVNVVDYKTGDPVKGKSKLKGPSEKDPNGGDYWRQAVFYKILVDHYEQKNWKVASSEFDFIEPDKEKKYRKEKIIITPADITTVTEQIKTVWEKIQVHDFYTGCGKENCHWCNFVKDYGIYTGLTEVPDETED
jgi:DNA helicase II / ATP-dependent DNA helicase PcrA